MKTLRLIALFLFISIAAFAQESTIKGVVAGSNIIPGRGMVTLLVLNQKGESLDSCLLGLDSSYAFKVKLKEVSWVKINFDYGVNHSENYILMPGESINTRPDANEQESEMAATIMSRENALSAALDAFIEFDFSFNYGLLDSVSFNAKLSEVKQTAIETLLSHEDSLPAALQQMALHTIELRAAEIYLNYAYLARFQQKHKTIRFLSPNFLQPLKQLTQLKVYPRQEYLSQLTTLDSLAKNLEKVNFDTEKLSPAYQILNHDLGPMFGRISYQLYPKSDGPNCNYGYTALSQSSFENLDVIIEDAPDMPSFPEGWIIEPKYERAMDFNDDGLAIVLDGMHYKLINIFGETVLQGGFEELNYYDSGVYIARKYNKYGLIEASGKSILDFQYEDLYALGGELFAFRFPGSPFMGMMDIKGNEIVKPRYGAIKPFEGREYAITVFYDYDKWTPRRVNKNLIKMPGEKYGVIDRTGREVLAPGWYSIVSQSHSTEKDFPLVVYKRTYSRLFKRFKIQNNFQMLDISGKLYPYNKRYPFLNEPGKHYYFSSNLEESVLRSTDGSFQSKPFRFGSNGLKSIADNFFVVRTENEQVFLLKDTAGKMQIDTFQSIRKLENEYEYDYNELSSRFGSEQSLYYVVKDNCYGLMKANGHMVLPMIYDDIENQDSLLFVKYKDKYAIFDTAGKQLTPFKYDEIMVFSQSLGLLKLVMDGKSQISDRNHNILFEAPTTKQVWMDGSNDLSICNWSYLKDDLLWQYNRKEHVLPYKDTVHYRYLSRGANQDYHVVNKNGRWLGTVEEDKTIDESEPLIVSRLGETMVVDLKNNNELKGNYNDIYPLYLSNYDKRYTSSSFKADDKTPKYYLFLTQQEKRGLTDASFKWLLDTSYTYIEVSKSFILAKKDKRIQLFDTLGQRYFDEKFGVRRKQPSIIEDKYIKIFKLFGGFNIYTKNGKRLIKAKKGGFDLTPKGNLMLTRIMSKRILIYDTLGKSVLKQKVKYYSNPYMGLMQVRAKKNSYFMSAEGDFKKQHPFKLGVPIITAFPTWLDTTNASDISDTTRKEWELGFQTYDVINSQGRSKAVVEYRNKSYGSEIWLPNTNRLRVDPKLAAAFVMVQWLNPESNKVPSLLDLKSTYINVENHDYEDGQPTSEVISYYIQNDSLYRVNTFGLFDEDNSYKFARLLTDKMGSDESINWNVCVKPDRLYGFLRPEFKLTDTGVEVIIRSLKVQNTKTNEIKIALSKEEVLPYLRPTTHFYQWFKKR